MLDQYSHRYLNELPDFLPSSMWVAEFPLDQGTGGNTTLEFLLKEVTLPLYKIDMKKTLFEFSVPEARVDFDDISFVLYETPKFEAFQYFNNKLKKIYDFEKKVWKKTYNSSKFKFNLKFIRFKRNLTNPNEYYSGSDDPYDVLAVFTCENTVVKEISSLSLQYDDPAPLTFSVVCGVEIIKFEYKGEGVNNVR